METDSFFCQLFKHLPRTLFDLLGLPAERADAYRFDSVELKKSLRIDGLFRPKKRGLPLYFLEVQFRHSPKFYANLFAKVFWYLEENDPAADWAAVSIFATRNAEPKDLGPYEELLQSKRVKRFYLDELPISADPPLGLGILRLVSAPVNETKHLVGRLQEQAENQISDRELASKVVELLEELLLRKFTQLDREEIRAMFQLHDLRESKVWQEAHQEGVEEGKTLNQRDLVRKLLDKGMSTKEIAALLDIRVKDVHRLAK